MKNLISILFLFVSLAVSSQTIITNSHIKTTSTGTGWDDINVSFETGLNGSAGYPPFDADSCTYSFTIDTTGPSKCMLYFIIELPHKWRAGSNLHPHVHYKYTAGQGTPTFVLKYKWFNILTKASTSWTWIRLNTDVVGSPTAYQMGIVEDSADTGISGTGKTLSSIIICQLYLYATGGVTKTCDAFQMGLHYETDSFGSNTEYTK